MDHVYTLQGSVLAARRGALGRWVTEFLASEGGNPALSAGLKLVPRSYFGPISLPLDVVERCCGPEAGMRYPVSQESFDRRVVGLRQAIEAGVSLPPLIVNFSESALTLNDGNHRFQALKDLGSKTFAAIIWTTGDVDMTMFMTLYSGCCQEIGP